MSNSFAMPPAVLAAAICSSILDGKVESHSANTGSRCRVTITIRDIAVKEYFRHQFPESYFAATKGWFGQATQPEYRTDGLAGDVVSIPAVDVTIFATYELPFRAAEKRPAGDRAAFMKRHALFSLLEILAGKNGDGYYDRMSEIAAFD